MADARPPRPRFDGVFGTPSRSKSESAGSSGISDFVSEASVGCAEDPEGEEGLKGSGSNSSSSRTVFVRGFFAAGLPLVGALRAGFGRFEGLGGGDSLSSPSDLVSAFRFLETLVFGLGVSGTVLLTPTAHLDQSPGGATFACSRCASQVNS